MPLIYVAYIAGAAAIGGLGIASYESGKTSGSGIGTAAVVIGVAAGVGIIIYALHT